MEIFWIIFVVYLSVGFGYFLRDLLLDKKYFLELSLIEKILSVTCVVIVTMFLLPFFIIYDIGHER